MPTCNDFFHELDKFTSRHVNGLHHLLRAALLADPQRRSLGKSSARSQHAKSLDEDEMASRPLGPPSLS
jgi:hypothetical protein